MVEIEAYLKGWERGAGGRMYWHRDTAIRVYRLMVGDPEGPGRLMWVVQPPGEDPWEEEFRDARGAIDFVEGKLHEWSEPSEAVADYWYPAQPPRG